MDKYLVIVKKALDAGIVPRCHFEDITRADYYGFVVPFAAALKDLSDESGMPIKIRCCDTLGYGVSFPGTGASQKRTGHSLRVAPLRRLPQRMAGMARA